MLKQEKGMVLPLILVTMFVLTLLGIALLQYGVTDTIQVAREERSMQAYYLARSGADAVAQYIIDNPSKAPSLILADKSEPFEFADGEFEVLVYGDPASEILVESTGRVQDTERTLILTLQKTNLFNVGLFAIQSI